MFCKHRLLIPLLHTFCLLLLGLRAPPPLTRLCAPDHSPLLTSTLTAFSLPPKPNGRKCIFSATHSMQLIPSSGPYRPAIPALARTRGRSRKCAKTMMPIGLASKCLAGSSSLLFLTSLSDFWGLRHRCSFRWYTDSTSAISRFHKFSGREEVSSRMPPDADLISIIASC